MPIVLRNDNTVGISLLFKEKKYIKFIHDATIKRLNAVKNSNSPVMFADEADQTLLNYKTTFDKRVSVRP